LKKKKMLGQAKRKLSIGMERNSKPDDADGGGEGN